MTINKKTFNEYHNERKTPCMNWTVYIYEFDDGKYYVGQTGQTLTHRRSTRNQERKKSSLLGRVHYHYNVTVDNLLRGGHLVKTYYLTGIESEEEARKIETEIIINLDTTNPDKGYNKQMQDVPARPIYQLDRDSGEIVKYWPSIKSAAKALNYPPNRLRHILDTEHTARGFKWQRA